jgi:hypothetical protein
MQKPNVKILEIFSRPLREVKKSSYENMKKWFFFKFARYIKLCIAPVMKNAATNKADTPISTCFGWPPRVAT